MPDMCKRFGFPTVFFILCVLMLSPLLPLHATGQTTEIRSVRLRFTAVAAGDSHILAIAEDGSLWAWGYNHSGQLGDGTTDYQETPVQIIAGGVVKIAGGGSHSLALMEDGSFWAWGNNRSGQLGDGTTQDQHSPILVMTAGPIQFSAGTGHTLAIMADQSLWAWGDNQNGQLGNGLLSDSLSPVQIMTDIIGTCAGAYTSAAIRKDGSLWTWGSNWISQLGDGTQQSRSVPVKIITDGVIMVSQSLVHGLALKQDGSLWAWGFNGDGRLGDGSTVSRSKPRQIIASGVRAAIAGQTHSLAILDDGSLWAWGENTSGQIGDGTKTDRYKPVKIMPDGVVTATAGSRLSVSLDQDGFLWAWPYRNERRPSEIVVLKEAPSAYDKLPAQYIRPFASTYDNQKDAFIISAFAVDYDHTFSLSSDQVSEMLKQGYIDLYQIYGLGYDYQEPTRYYVHRDPHNRVWLHPEREPELDPWDDNEFDAMNRSLFLLPSGNRYELYCFPRGDSSVPCAVADPKPLQFELPLSAQGMIDWVGSEIPDLFTIRERYADRPGFYGEFSMIKAYIDGSVIRKMLLIDANESTTIFISGQPQPTDTEPVPTPTPRLQDHQSAVYRLIIGQDNNQFSNGRTSFFGDLPARKHRYTLSQHRYEQLVAQEQPAVQDLILREMNQRWEGACFGIAAAQVLVKLEEIDLANIDPNARLFAHLSQPVVSQAVMDLTHYYQLAQFLPQIDSAFQSAGNPARSDNYTAGLKAVLSRIIDLAKAIDQGGKPFMITFSWATRNSLLDILIRSELYRNDGHAVIGNGYEQLADGSHQIVIVDPNKCDETIYLQIGRGLNTWQFIDRKGSRVYPTENWLTISFADFKAFDSIDFDGDVFSRPKPSGQPANTTIYWHSAASFLLTDDQGRQLRYIDGDFTGDLRPIRIGMTAGAADSGVSRASILIELEPSRIYFFEPTQRDLHFSLLTGEVFASVEASGASAVVLEPGRYLRIDGRQISYTASFSDVTVGPGLIQIADQGINQAVITYTPEGLVLSANPLKEVTIGTIQAGYQSQTRISTEQTRILLAEHTTAWERSLAIYQTRDDDGEFTQLIGQTQPFSPDTPMSSVIWLIGGSALILIIATVWLLLRRQRQRY